ncbi:MAG: prepilin-type N-terminal cleavage/methylation domain-containing protein [Candidatus Moraniibacteriota bacterium]
MKNSQFQKILILKGMSLIEMIIAIAIFTMGMAGFSTLFLQSWKQNSYTLEMGQTAIAISQSVNKLSRYIREARQADNGSYPVVSANDNDLVFYCDYDKDGVTERIHIYKSGTDIVLGVRDPSGSFPITYASGDATTSVIAQRIVNTGSQPIFLYYDASYPEDSVNNPIVTPATVPNVRLVKINLYMNIDPNHAPDNVNIQSFAEMRNLNDHDRFGI